MKIFTLNLLLLLSSPVFAAAPNDPFFAKQWSLQNDGSQTVVIDADDMHTILQKGNPGIDIGFVDAKDFVEKNATNPVIVAVIDTGLDAGHPDLAGRVAPGAFDFLLNFPIVTDKIGHGTHVSGIIAANSDNEIGITGITPKSVQILPLTVLWPDGDPKSSRFAYLDPTAPASTPKLKLLTDFAADAIRYAVAHKANIINMSFGWPKIVDTTNIRNAVNEANAAGVLIVVSAGNDRKEQATYPCTYENVLCVGAITNTGEMSIYSNYGGLVDILGPGDGIISTFPQLLESSTLRVQGYEMLSGTSQATPHVSGIAAILKSIYPNITPSELKARLLLSASTPPSKGGALYGLVNLARAINLQAQAAYLPNFKGMGDILVDENSLKTTGSISVQNLWQDAKKVTLSLSINGIAAGKLKLAKLSEGDSISLPWSYQFSSLDAPADMQFVLTIQDASKSVKTFSYQTSAIRDISGMASRKVLAVPGIKSSDWIATQNGQPFSLVHAVDNYPSSFGLPRYYQQSAWGDAGSEVQLYDPSTSELIHKVQVPGIKTIKQVIHSSNGNWIFTGIDQAPNSRQNPSYWEFYFLDANFQPLYGSSAASEWQISNNLNLVIRNYSTPGSWISGEGKLIPSFLAAGTLPSKDNYGELDIRHYQGANHLYYLDPIGFAQNNNSAPVQLELRALDNSVFRNQYPDANLLNIIPADPNGSAKGEIHILVNKGNTLSAQTQIWDIKDISSNSLSLSPGWDSLAASGSPLAVLTGNPNTVSNAFLNFFDSSRGSIAWTNQNGDFSDSSSFQFHSSENPITGIQGIFNLPASGRFWFLESSFDLVGFHQADKDQSITTKSIPIERDSSFASQDFSQMFTPVTVGSSTNPIPGVYIDSTLVRGNQVGIATWTSDQGLTKPLRYALRIPANCAQMNPFQDTDGRLELPLFCTTSSTDLEFDLVTP